MKDIYRERKKETQTLGERDKVRDSNIWTEKERLTDRQEERRKRVRKCYYEK